MKQLQHGLKLLMGLAMLSGAAYADSATTTGGIRIKSDDGKFEAGLGGRIQVDTVIFSDDRLADAGVFNSTSGVYIRRAYLTLTGKLYDFSYKFENDFAAGSSPGSFRELWISHPLLGGDLIIGQRKPFRGLEELQSDLDNELVERPFLTNVLFASGSARQYQPGAFYLRPVGAGTLGVSVYNANHALGQAPSQGVGTSDRLSYPVINSGTTVLHLGISGGFENFSKTSPGTQSVAYAGRSNSSLGQVVGPTQPIWGIGTGKSQTFVNVETAGTFGPIFLEGEYGRSTYEDGVKAGKDDHVYSYYVQAGWFVTGETRPYKTATGVFTVPKPKNSFGAVELVARYDFVGNEDLNASAIPAPTPPSTTAPSALPCQASSKVARIGKNCEVHQYTAGVNYYINPAVRVAFNYVYGDNSVADDQTQSVNLRLQLAF